MGAAGPGREVVLQPGRRANDGQQRHTNLRGLLGNVRLVKMVRELRLQTRMVDLALKTMSEELPESAREHHILLDRGTAQRSKG